MCTAPRMTRSNGGGGERRCSSAQGDSSARGGGSVTRLLALVLLAATATHAAPLQGAFDSAPDVSRDPLAPSATGATRERPTHTSRSDRGFDRAVRGSAGSRTALAPGIPQDVDDSHTRRASVPGAREPRALQGSISTPRTELPYRGFQPTQFQVRFSRETGYTPFTVTLSVGENATFVWPEDVPLPEFNDTSEMPGFTGSERIVYRTFHTLGADPDVTCDFRADEFIQFAWETEIVVRESQGVQAVACIGLLPASNVVFQFIESNDFAGLLYVMLGWLVLAGGSLAASAAYTFLRLAGLLPVFDLKSMVLAWIRFAVFGVSVLFNIDLYLSNNFMFAVGFSLALFAGSALNVLTARLFFTPKFVSDGGPTAPAVRMWAATYRTQLWVLSLLAGSGGHVLGLAISGLFNRRYFSAPAGIARRHIFFLMGWISALTQDLIALSLASFLLSQNEPDVLVPQSCFLVAVLAGSAIVVVIVIAVLSPVAGEEAKIVSKLSAVYAMQRQVAWLQKKELEEQMRREEAERQAIELEIQGGVVENTVRTREGMETVRKVGVSPGTRTFTVQPTARSSNDGLTPNRNGGETARSGYLSARGGVGDEVLVPDAAELDTLEGLVKFAREADAPLALDERGGFVGLPVPIPQAKGVRPEVVRYLRGVHQRFDPENGGGPSLRGGHASPMLRVPGMPPPVNAYARHGNPYAPTSTGASPPSKYAAWSGTSGMEVVGRPLTPPELKKKKSMRKGSRRRLDSRGQASSRIGGSDGHFAETGASTARSVAWSITDGFGVDPARSGEEGPEHEDGGPRGPHPHLSLRSRPMVMPTIPSARALEDGTEREDPPASTPTARGALASGGEDADGRADALSAGTAGAVRHDPVETLMPETKVEEAGIAMAGGLPSSSVRPPSALSRSSTNADRPVTPANSEGTVSIMRRARAQSSSRGKSVVIVEEPMDLPMSFTRGNSAASSARGVPGMGVYASPASRVRGDSSAEMEALDLGVPSTNANTPPRSGLAAGVRGAGGVSSTPPGRYVGGATSPSPSPPRSPTRSPQRSPHSAAGSASPTARNTSRDYTMDDLVSMRARQSLFGDEAGAEGPQDLTLTPQGIAAGIPRASSRLRFSSSSRALDIPVTMGGTGGIGGTTSILPGGASSSKPRGMVPAFNTGGVPSSPAMSPAQADLEDGMPTQPLTRSPSGHSASFGARARLGSSPSPQVGPGTVAESPTMMGLPPRARLPSSGGTGGGIFPIREEGGEGR